MIKTADYQRLLNLQDAIFSLIDHEDAMVATVSIGIFTQNRLNREQILTQIVKALIGQYHYYQSKT